MRLLARSKVHVAVLLPLPSGSSPALGLAETSPPFVTPGLALTLGTLLMSLGRAASQPFPLPCSSSKQAHHSLLLPALPLQPHHPHTTSRGSCAQREHRRALLQLDHGHERLLLSSSAPAGTQPFIVPITCHFPASRRYSPCSRVITLEITPSPFISSHAVPGEAGTKGAAPPGSAGPGCPTPCLLEAGLALGAVAPSPPGLELGAQTLPSYQLPNKPWWL